LRRKDTDIFPNWQTLIGSNTHRLELEPSSSPRMHSSPLLEAEAYAGPFGAEGFNVTICTPDFSPCLRSRSQALRL
jgi:hypothetical protein